MNGIRVFLLIPIIASTCVTNNPSNIAESKLEASLRMVVKDPAGYQNRSVPFTVEKKPDGTVIVPVFVRTTNVSETRKAIVTAGGTTSSAVGEDLVARLPMSSILKIAERKEVVRIEPSSKLHLAPRQ
jgi:hypothetical protein